MDALRKHKHELQKSLPPTPASLEVRKRKGLVNEDEADWVPNPKRKSKGKGKGGEEAARGVLTFFGGYSIVAQPKISATARLDKLVGRMEEIGFR